MFSPADFADEGADKYADRASSKFMLLEIYHYFIVCLLILELDQFNTSELRNTKSAILSANLSAESAGENTQFF